MSPSPLGVRKVDASLVRHAGLALLFKAQARLLGPLTAIEYGEYTVSYEELHLKPLQLARPIRLGAPEPGTPIAVAIPRGVNHIFSQIAIVYAGGTCVPLDSKQPDIFLVVRSTLALFKQLSSALVNICDDILLCLIIHRTGMTMLHETRHSYVHNTLYLFIFAFPAESNPLSVLY